MDRAVVDFRCHTRLTKGVEEVLQRHGDGEQRRIAAKGAGMVGSHVRNRTPGKQSWPETHGCIDEWLQ